MSKSILTFLLLFITAISIFSQKTASNMKPYSQTHAPIIVRGVINKNYYTSDVSPHIKNILFLQERANLILPDRSYLIDLDDESKQNIGLESIYVLAANNHRDNLKEVWNEEDTIVTQVYPMKGSSSIYYTDMIKLMNEHIEKEHNRLSDFWLKPTPTDTIFGFFYSESDLRFTAQMIEQIDNQMMVGYKSEMRTFSNDKCEYITLGMDTPVSEHVRNKLEDLQKLPFKAPNKDASKTLWQQWYKWLPEVEITETDEKYVRWKNAYDEGSRIEIKGDIFLQTYDASNNIYYITKDSTYIVDTKNNSMDITAGFDPSLKNKAWKVYNQDKDEYAEQWIDENEVLFDDSEYLKLQDENTLIVTIENTHFQQFAKVYRMNKEGQISKAKILMSTIPLEENGGNNLSIEKIFEANGNYYVIITTANNCYWNVFDETLFRVQRRGFIQDKERDKDMHKQEKKQKQQHKHRF